MERKTFIIISIFIATVQNVTTQAQETTSPSSVNAADTSATLPPSTSATSSVSSETNTSPAGASTTAGGETTTGHQTTVAPAQSSTAPATPSVSSETNTSPAGTSTTAGGETTTGPQTTVATPQSSTAPATPSVSSETNTSPTVATPQSSATPTTPSVSSETNTSPAGASTTAGGETTPGHQITVSPAQSSTAPPTSSVSSETNTSPAGTSSIPSTVSTTFTTSTTSRSTTANIPEVFTDLVFRSVDTFVEALRNSSTEEFKSRSTLVRNQLEGIYRPKYNNFLRVDVIGFSPGSIITKTQIVFGINQSLPSTQEILNTLVTAAETGSVNLLNIIPGSVSVNGSDSTTTVAPAATTASSGFKIESSLLQATCLIIMTKILRLFLWFP